MLSLYNYVIFQLLNCLWTSWCIHVKCLWVLLRFQQTKTVNSNKNTRTCYSFSLHIKLQYMKIDNNCTCLAHSSATRDTAVSPAVRRPHTWGAPRPSGVTSPMPVTTTLRPVITSQHQMNNLKKHLTILICTIWKNIKIDWFRSDDFGTKRLSIDMQTKNFVSRNLVMRLLFKFLWLLQTFFLGVFDMDFTITMRKVVNTLIF